MRHSLIKGAAALAVIFSASSTALANPKLPESLTNKGIHSYTCGSEKNPLMKKYLQALKKYYEKGSGMGRSSNGAYFKVYSSKDKNAVFPRAVVVRFQDGYICMTPSPIMK